MTDKALIEARRRIDEITDQRMSSFESAIKDVFSRINIVSQQVSNVSKDISMYQGSMTTALNRAELDISKITANQEDTNKKVGQNKDDIKKYKYIIMGGAAVVTFFVNIFMWFFSSK